MRTEVLEMGDHYRCIVANIVGSPEAGYGTSYYIDPRALPSVAAAKHYGLRTLDRSDDFNIGQWRDGRLVAVLWMNEVVDDDPELMRRIEVDGHVRHKDRGAADA